MEPAAIADPGRAHTRRAAQGPPAVSGCASPGSEPGRTAAPRAADAADAAPQSPASDPPAHHPGDSLRWYRSAAHSSPTQINVSGPGGPARRATSIGQSPGTSTDSQGLLTSSASTSTS